MNGPLKRQRFSIGRNVCVFSRSNDEENGEYRIYFLDLDTCCNTNTKVDGDGYTHILPTLRFDVQRPRTFCSLGSALYIFEGFNKFDSKYQGKSALKVELCQTSLPLNHKFEDLELDTCKLCDMHYSKFRPHAIPTPDGKKILVFSTKFCGYEEEGDSTHFELYDPMSNSWLKLPGLSPYQFHWNEPWSFEAYSFIDDHVFFIQVTSGMFALDLESLDKGWKVLGDLQVPWNCGYFIAISNKFVFTSHWIYDAREVGLARQVGDPEPSAAVVPQSSFPSTDGDIERYEWLPCLPSITLVHHDTDNGVVRWCVLRSKDAPDIEDTTTSYTRVLIDVYDTHLATLKSKNIRSLKLLLDHHDWLKELEFVRII